MIHAHEDMDDTGEWSAGRHIPAPWKLTELDLDRAISERRPFIPLGCDQQGRHHPTFVDRMSEQYDMEDQSQSADADVALFLLWLMAGIAIVVLTISGFCFLYKAWMAL
mgnify:FL=1